MSDYCCDIRSNYFLVKDEEMFVEFMKRFEELEVITTKATDQTNPGDEFELLYGFMNEYGTGIPSCYYNEHNEEIDIDFAQELATYLAEGEVAVVFEVGGEKMRYLFGGAWAINSKGEIKDVNLGEIYERAKTLGTLRTMAEY